MANTVDALAAEPDFRLLFAALPGCHLVLDLNLTIVAASDAYLLMTGRTRDGIVAHHVFDIFPEITPGGAVRLRESFHRVMHDRSVDVMPVLRYDIERSTSNGVGIEPRFWTPVNSPVLDDDGEVAYVLNTVNDVTDLMQANVDRQEQTAAYDSLKVATDQSRVTSDRESAELSDANSELRALGAILGGTVKKRSNELRATVAQLDIVNRKHRLLLRRLLTLQEEEQRRIANDIHDDTLQSIIVAQMRLQIMAPKLSNPQLISELKQIEASVGEAVAELRGLMFELRPDALEHGVAAMLQVHLDDLAAVSGIDGEMTAAWAAEPRGVEQITLYRIAREALVNIRKHVSRCRVSVDLADCDGGWAITVRDEGDGFVVADALAATGHLGLTSMRERAEALGGHVEMISILGQGTTVECWIPSGQSAMVAVQ